MSAFGTLVLLVAFAVATYGGVASVVGARRGNPRLIASGRAAVYALAALLGLASVAILYAFVTGDFSIKYVQRYSDSSSPLFYRLTAYWGGLDGSILWWAFLLSVFSAIAVHTNRHRHREILPYTIAVLMGVADFFLYLIVFHKNPFQPFLSEVPAAGNGLNPLLQNPYMITHPPALYTGFVGMTIPYAFAMGALISGHLDDAWIASVRKWTLIAWFFLAMGLTLGMLWAYEELGWGGFWGWDPVENAGLLPWLTGTAFLHSVMVQERRGMMKVWNFSLVILTFFLTIFGTFMTRSGIVQSVHAFGQDTKLAWIFTVFMAALLIFSFGLVIKRLPELRSRNTLESWLSREGAFLLNNWILVFSAFFVLFATMFPTIAEALRGDRMTVAAPFFNKWMVPIGLCLLFLTGIGAPMAWRKASSSSLRYQFTWPTVALVVTLVVCFAVGLRESWAALVCFGFCGFTLTTIAQEFWRGAAIRRKNTGSDPLTAMLGMILRGRRRYGGYVVHVGIVCMFIGFAGQAYQREEDVVMKPGEERAFGKYTLKLDRLSLEEDRQKEMVTGHFTVVHDGKVIDRLFPGIWYYNNKNNDRTSEVAIRRSPAEDLYITLANYDLADQTGNFKLVVNPLVDWIWLGFMMLAFGTGIALLPERAWAPLASRVQAGEAAAGGATVAGMLLLAGALLLGGTAHAAPSAAQVDADQRWLEKNMICMCGCRHLLADCGGECGPAPAERKIIRTMLEEGKTRDDVIKFFVDRYGGMDVMAAPPDKGFNRLAWALPYGLGLAGAGVLAFGAWRFSRRPVPVAAGETPAPARPTAADAHLEDRLDEELDKID
jgi:cytochrome c-type biogenesis protein CcmF